MKNSLKSLIAIAISSVVAGSSAFAASATWNGGSGNWNSSNWTPAAAPGTLINSSSYPNNTDTATFSSGTGTVVVDAGRQLGSITFGTGAGSYTLSGGPLYLFANGSVQMASTLTGSNITDTISAPIVYATSNYGGIYNYSTNATNVLNIAGGITDAESGGSANISLGGAAGGGGGIVSGVIGNGTGGVAITLGGGSSGTGAVKWIFSAANTNSGGISISSYGNAWGVLQLNNANGVQNSVVGFNSGQNNELTFNSGVDTVSLQAMTGGTGGSPTAPLTENLVDSGGNAVTLVIGLYKNANGNTYGGTLTGTGGVTKVGWGTQTFSAANTYTGTTTVTGLTLNSSSQVDTLASTLGTSGTPFGTGSVVLNGGRLSIAPGSGTTVSDTGANATTSSTFTYGGGADLFLTKGTGLTYTVGNASATGKVLVQSGTTGTLIIQTGTNGDLGAGAATGEDFLVNGTAPATNASNHMVSASIVTLNGGTSSTSGAGDFLTYGTTNGFASDSANYMARSGTIAGGTITSTNEISNFSSSATLSGTNSTGDLLVQSGQTLTLNTGAVLNVGDGGTTNPAGIILNSANITGGTLNFGSEEGIVYGFKGNSQIKSAITGTGGVVLSGFGNNQLDLGNGGTAVNSTFTGGLTIEGGINYYVQESNGGGVDNTQFGAPTNVITLDGAQFNESNGASVLAASRSVVLGPDGANIYGNSDSYNLNISGSGALTYTGGSGGSFQGYTVTTGVNTYTGGTFLQSGLVAISSQTGVGNSQITFVGNAGLSIAGNNLHSLSNVMTFDVAGGAYGFDIQNVNNTFTLSNTQIIDSGSGGLFKAGAGTLALDGAETYSGGTTIYGGTLLVDGSNGGSLGSYTALTLDGGSLYLKNAAGATTVQNLGNITMGGILNGNNVAVGGNNIIVNANGGTETVNLGTLPGLPAVNSGGVATYPAINQGSALQLQVIGSGAKITTTSTPDGTGSSGGNGIYSGRIVYTDASGNTNWATDSTSSTVNGTTYYTITAYNTANYSTDLQSVANNGSSNAIVTSTEVDGPPTYYVNSLQITPSSSGQSLDLGGTPISIASGGLLFTGSNNFTIEDNGLSGGGGGGGLLTSTLQSLPNNIFMQYGQTYANSSDLIIQDYSTGVLTIASPTFAGATGIYTDPTILAGSTSSGTASANFLSGAGQAASLTKAGPGTLVLTGPNTYTGPTYIDGGVLSIASDASIGGSNGVVTGVTSSTSSPTVTIAASSLPVGFGVGSAFLGNGNYVKSITLNAAGTLYTVTLYGNANTTLSNGTASFATDSGLLIDGGTLEVTSNINMQQVSATSGSGVETQNRSIALGSSGGTIDVVNGSTLTYNGNFYSGASGWSSLVVDSNDGSNGRLYLTSPYGSTIDGGITINGGILESAANLTNGLSTLTFGSGSEISPGTNKAVAGATVNTTPTLLMDASEVFLGLDSPATTTAVVEANSVGNKTYLQIDNGGSDSYSGLLENGAAYNTTLGFSKGGSGIQYLTNNNSTYTGITTIDAGTLNVSSISNGGLTANITTTLGGTSATLSSIVGTLVIGQIYTVDSANVPIGTTFTYTGSPTVTLTSAATAAGTNVGADVGVASALGFATNAAGNLIFGGALNGGAVLQYNATTGPVSTDRLFTIGDNSTTNTGNGLSGSISGDTATLDSSSSVAADTVSFTNTGAIAFQNTAYTHNLTLTGSNTGTQAGVNTFAPLLGDMAGGQSTSLNKTGTGTWALTNNNTYSGGTIISAGKLYVNNGGGASYSPPTTSALRPITATNSGSGTGTGAVTVLSGGTLAGSGTITPTGGAGVTVQTGGTLASGGLQSGTSAGAGLTLSNTEASSTLLSLQGGVTLSFDLGSTVNNAGSGFDAYGNPNTNSTYLSITGNTVDQIFSNSTLVDNIHLVDLTAGSSSVTLTLRYDNPYLLIQTALGNNADFANLVTNNGIGVNGYVYGVSNGTGGYTAFNITATDINGAALANPYAGMQLYLYNGDLEVVPEPGTWALMIGGLALLVVIQRRKNRV